jgi:PAS domain S-box-containing protein
MAKPGSGVEASLEFGDEVPIGFLVLDAAGRIARANRRAADIFARTVAELVGRPMSDFIADTPLERARALTVGSHYPSGDPLEHDEIQIGLPDGRLRWIRITIDPVRDSAGQVTTTRMVMEDAERELNDAASLRRASVRFRIAFENAPVGMHLSTAGGRFLEVNRALCWLAGYSEAQLLTMQVWDLVHPDDLEGFAPARAALFSGAETSLHLDSRFVVADGSTRWCRLEAVLPNGLEGYLVSQITDISDLVEAREHLAGMVKAKDRFVASVSHELRTPLSGVLGFASELRDRSARFSRAEIVEFAGLIARECAVANNLVEDLLVAARLDNEDLGFDLGPTDLHWQAFAVTSEPNFAYRTQGKPIQVEGQPALAWADASRVRQIIRNLVSNAGRYGGERIAIVVGMKLGGGGAFLRVTDDGPGVSASLEGQLFGAYQHGLQESGRTDSVGLGLYISRKLARLMNGDVTYRREGGLTIFELVLPPSDLAKSHDA